MAKIESVYDVATVLGSLDTRRWPEVCTALETGGSGHAFAPEIDFGNPPEIPELAHDLYQEAVEITETNRLMRQAARSLHGNIGEAVKHIERAVRNIGELRDLGDVEYLEGDGSVEALLKQAKLLLASAQALKTTDEMGDMR
jgi:hypothetical protein